ncbi:MAG: rRNA ((1498)-N(3))-methyltransferase [Flavisolibacter sp.]|jgi:16S rRNA (uracil1498-N3)-methyltransferase|nr:rRNA ((1498)-N(3))-methyltransferase [Flavisolibacter sp.]
MSIPLFYIQDISSKIITLDEDTSKHIISVLRMQKEEQVLLTDGKGTKATATIIDDNRKRCSVQIVNADKQDQSQPKITIAISIIKNASRFEWFLEKATEIGVSEIIPLLCERTEKEKFRYDRMKGILVSAMLQSQQTWLPILHQPTSFETVIKGAAQEQKFIAHCLPENKVSLTPQLSSLSTNQLILIGPEGDFTPNEINLALQNNFTPVALGNTRLRTETAGIVAATLIKMGKA